MGLEKGGLRRSVTIRNMVIERGRTANTSDLVLLEYKVKTKKVRRCCAWQVGLELMAEIWRVDLTATRLETGRPVRKL